MTKFFEKKDVVLDYADCLFILHALKIYLSIKAIDSHVDCWTYSVLEDLLGRFEEILKDEN